VQDYAPNGGSRIPWVLSAWTMTVASGVVYAVWLQGLPDTRNDVEFYLWAAGVSAGSSLVAVFTIARFRYLVLAFLAAPAAGFAGAYCLALLTYGSGAEDGTVWRGIGGAVLGAISAITAWVVIRLSAYRSNHARVT
jgi:hypothetical protein